MKKIILLLFAALIGIAATNAQTLQEILKDSPELTKLFVHPCGISKPVGEMTAEEMTAELDNLKLDYKTINLGAMGTVFQVSTPDLKIGGVETNAVGLSVGDAICMVTYFSNPCDNYMDLEKSLTPQLSKFPKLDPSAVPMPMPNTDGVEMYQITDSYSIAVGGIPEGKVATAMMVCIKNPDALINMFGTTPQQ